MVLPVDGFPLPLGASETLSSYGEAFPVDRFPLPVDA